MNYASTMTERLCIISRNHIWTWDTGVTVDGAWIRFYVMVPELTLTYLAIVARPFGTTRDLKRHEQRLRKVVDSE